MMHFGIRRLTSDQSVLAGALPGRALFGALVADAFPPGASAPGFLDFSGVTVATASFLRESAVAFRDHARAALPNLYPVIANAASPVSEELDYFLRHRRDAMWCCEVAEGHRPSAARVLGELDEPHAETLRRVIAMGAATAPALAADGEVAATAWNNRLSYLAARGLLIEGRRGKTKVFSPVLESM